MSPCCMRCGESLAYADECAWLWRDLLGKEARRHWPRPRSSSGSPNPDRGGGVGAADLGGSGVRSRHCVERSIAVWAEWVLLAGMQGRGVGCDLDRGESVRLVNRDSLQRQLVLDAQCASEHASAGSLGTARSCMAPWHRKATETSKPSTV